MWYTTIFIYNVTVQLGISLEEEEKEEKEQEKEEEEEVDADEGDDDEEEQEKEVANLMTTAFGSCRLRFTHGISDAQEVLAEMPEPNLVPVGSAKVFAAMLEPHLVQFGRRNVTPLALKDTSSSSIITSVLPKSVPPHADRSRCAKNSSTKIDQLQLATADSCATISCILADFSQDLIELKWRVNWKRKRWKLGT